VQSDLLATARWASPTAEMLSEIAVITGNKEELFMKGKAIIEEKAQRLIEMTSGFCAEYLDGDYKQLCEKLIQKMSRKRNVPFLSGRIEIWAAAIVYAIGSINFLFDRSFEPYASGDDICNYFGTSKSTTSQKAKVIRDMSKLGYWDKEFSTSYMMQSSPFSNLVMVNGFIVDERSLPPEIQEIIPQKGRHKK
jgi:hypothetical protein